MPYINVLRLAFKKLMDLLRPVGLHQYFYYFINMENTSILAAFVKKKGWLYWVLSKNE